MRLHPHTPCAGSSALPCGPLCAVSPCLSLCPSKRNKRYSPPLDWVRTFFHCTFIATLANYACVLLQGKCRTFLGTQWVCLKILAF